MKPSAADAASNSDDLWKANDDQGAGAEDQKNAADAGGAKTSSQD